MIQDNPPIPQDEAGHDYQGDLQFQRAASFSKSYQGLSAHLSINICQDAADSFQLRIENVRHMAILPIDLAALALFHGKIGGYLRKQKGITFDEKINQDDEIFVAEVQELYSRYTLPANKSWVLGHKFLAGVLEPLITNPHDDPTVRGYIADGAKSMLGSMIITSWMCLETLIEDLWIALVNNNPSLAFAVIDSNGDSLQQKKSISTSAFKKYGFDLSKSMGAILIEQNKADFRTMKGARLAYKQALKGEIKTLDEYANKLKSFEAVRNLLAHRGGMIDDKFLTMTKDDTKFKDLKVGSLLSITGDMVAEYATLAVDAAVDILVEVDNALTVQS